MVDNGPDYWYFYDSIYIRSGLMLGIGLDLEFRRLRLNGRLARAEKRVWQRAPALFCGRRHDERRAADGKYGGGQSSGGMGEAWG